MIPLPLIREVNIMNIYYVREKLRTRSIYDINLNVAYYARVSTELIQTAFGFLLEHLLMMEFLEFIRKKEKNFRE